MKHLLTCLMFATLACDGSIQAAEPDKDGFVRGRVDERLHKCAGEVGVSEADARGEPGGD